MNFNPPTTGGGMSVDTAANGPPPSPWEVPVQPKEPFKDEKKVVEVPHTASVQVCRKECYRGVVMW